MHAYEFVRSDLIRKWLRKMYRRCLRYINASGEFVIEPTFDRAYPFSEAVAAVEIKSESGERKAGFIDRSGELVITPRFSLGFHFHVGSYDRNKPDVRIH